MPRILAGCEGKKPRAGCRGLKEKAPAGEARGPASVHSPPWPHVAQLASGLPETCGSAPVTLGTSCRHSQKPRPPLHTRPRGRGCAGSQQQASTPSGPQEAQLQPSTLCWSQYRSSPYHLPVRETQTQRSVDAHSLLLCSAQPPPAFDAQAARRRTRAARLAPAAADGAAGAVAPGPAPLAVSPRVPVSGFVFGWTSDELRDRCARPPAAARRVAHAAAASAGHSVPAGASTLSVRASLHSLPGAAGVPVLLVAAGLAPGVPGRGVVAGGVVDLQGAGEGTSI